MIKTHDAAVYEPIHSDPRSLLRESSRFRPPIMATFPHIHGTLTDMV